MSELNFKLIIALARTQNKLTARTENQIAIYGLNLSEFGVLEMLYNKGPQPVQQIAEKILVTSGTITYNIDKLQKKGYITRKQSENDKRIYHVSLTDSGIEIMKDVFPAHEKFIDHLFRGVDEEVKQALINNLKLFQQQIEF